MARIAWLVVGLVVHASASASFAQIPLVESERIRQAVERALPLLEAGSAGHLEHRRSCFSCHNQGIPLMALATAHTRGFKVSADGIREHVQGITGFLNTNKENYLQGKGTGGQVDTAGYLLWTLEALSYPPDESTAAVAKYLRTRDANKDFWRTVSNRPPSEASSFTTSFLAVRGLKAFGESEPQEEIEKRLGRLRGWLEKTPAKDHEDRVFKLWAMKVAGCDEKALQSARQELLASQDEVGGWSQTAKLAPDTYATGSALVALHEAGGLPSTDTAYRLGLAYLCREQKSDGSWFVKSRSKPFQKYFESGFPHAEDQFISIAASAWAVKALALALPPVKGVDFGYQDR